MLSVHYWTYPLTKNNWRIDARNTKIRPINTKRLINKNTMRQKS